MVSGQILCFCCSHRGYSESICPHPTLWVHYVVCVCFCVSGQCCSPLLHSRKRKWWPSKSGQETLPPDGWDSVLWSPIFSKTLNNKCLGRCDFFFLHQTTQKSLWLWCHYQRSVRGWCCEPWTDTVPVQTVVPRPGSVYPTAVGSSTYMLTVAGQTEKHKELWSRICLLQVKIHFKILFQGVERGGGSQTNHSGPQCQERRPGVDTRWTESGRRQWRNELCSGNTADVTDPP